MVQSFNLWSFQAETESGGASKFRKEVQQVIGSPTRTEKLEGEGEDQEETEKVEEFGEVTEEDEATTNLAGLGEELEGGSEIHECEWNSKKPMV